MPSQVEDSKIISLANKVTVCSDDKLTALVPEKRPAIIKVTTYKNDCYVEQVDLPKGEPENPLTEDEIKDKFISLALYRGTSQKKADEIIRRVWDVENEDGSLYGLL